MKTNTVGIKITILTMLVSFLVSACTGVRMQVVKVHYFTHKGITFKRSSEYLSKKTMAYYEDFVHKYAPFCDWESDTIIMETMFSVVSPDEFVYAFSSKSDSLLYSKDLYNRELTQEGSASIDDFYSPARIGIITPREMVEERIAALKNIKYWQTDSIEDIIKKNGYVLSDGGDRLNRIIIKNNKIVSISTYFCNALTFYY